jgi:leucyl-tRNA synthetase
MEYDFNAIQNKWNKYWEENKTFKTDIKDFSKPKYYVLDMFPYPSAQGLHVGHPEGYTATDILARMKRMQGFNVLHPMGFDSFGLPAEQYAIKTGNHPGKFTEQNIANFVRQLKMLGFSYDWDRQISTCDPKYYKWTQWIFLQLFKDGYAKNVDTPVNWCEGLGTVLANDEIIDGKSERGGFPVVKRNMKQWVIDVPKFAEDLLSGLDTLDWPESTKEAQRNWIGKSEGVQVDFKINDTNVPIFTTCIETIYGVTFIVISPENEIVDKLLPLCKNRQEVIKFREEVKKQSDLERSDLSTEKQGVVLDGVFAINPVNNTRVKVCLGNFVLNSYGTGAVMAVPTHDQRDFEFAKKYNLPMIQVIQSESKEENVFEKAYEKQDYLGKNAKLINSEEFSGLVVEDAKKKITDKLIKLGVAEKKVNYKIREWIFARQRYWGEPVPIVYLENGEIYPLKDSELPLVLPELSDYNAKNGKAPLDNATEWKNVIINGVKGERETNTMPGSAGSSWYYLRFIDPNNDKEIADPELLKHWMPVDFYMGGPEHAVGHLIYSRVWNRYLYNKGITFTKEPFMELRHQGMILGENNEKMSKSRGNVVNPDDVVREYGADALRLYEMFLGPIQDAKPWSTKNVEGSKRFLERVWRLFTDSNKVQDKDNLNLNNLYNETVNKVSDDYSKLAFNTAISQMMIFINACYKEGYVPKIMAEGFVKLLNPIAPYITEEIWNILGHTKTIAYENWPKTIKGIDSKKQIKLPIQINGKVKNIILVDENLTNDEIMEIVKNDEKIKSLLISPIQKVIIVPNRIVNIIL